MVDGWVIWKKALEDVLPMLVVVVVEDNGCGWDWRDVLKGFPATSSPKHARIIVSGVSITLQG